MIDSTSQNGKRQREKRRRHNFSCRIQAEHQSQLGMILWYLEQNFIDNKELVSEFLRHAYYVRALTLANRKKDYNSSSFVNDNQYLKEEAVKGIFYFWGVIESLCAAAGISPESVANRLGGGSTESNSKSRDLRVSELASLMAEEIEVREQSGEKVSREPSSTPNKGNVAADSTDNMSKITSLFSD